MKKKLYYKLSDNFDVNEVTMDLKGVMDWIEGDADEDDIEEKVYTIEPVYMTEEEFDNLPEYDG